MNAPFQKPAADEAHRVPAEGESIAVLGLGYVGLPVAVAMAERLGSGASPRRVVGYDISANRVAQLRSGHDVTREISDARLAASGLEVSDDEAALAGASFIVVTVPTPITEERRPDLGPLRSACEAIAPHMAKGALVVFESTVYPGATEDFCGDLLEKLSGMQRGRDFTLGYSPERINPGDREHRLETITKIIAAEDAGSLARMRAVYGAIIDAGLHEAPSIMVAEAAKVIENTQRDLNVALMNEIALIFDRMGIATKDVLAAAGTKWNFLPFTPGLVGGHCIGVDPYYLTAAAERLGYRPEVILAGRRVNDGMGAVIAQKLVKLLASKSISLTTAQIGIMGLTFKQDVPDLRNSKVPDIIDELREFGIEPLVADAHANPEQAMIEYGIDLADADSLTGLDGLILAVNHSEYISDQSAIFARLREEGIIVDVKSVLDPQLAGDRQTYWSL